MRTCRIVFVRNMYSEPPCMYSVEWSRVQNAVTSITVAARPRGHTVHIISCMYPCKLSQPRFKMRELLLFLISNCL